MTPCGHQGTPTRWSIGGVCRRLLEVETSCEVSVWDISPGIGRSIPGNRRIGRSIRRRPQARHQEAILRTDLLACLRPRLSPSPLVGPWVWGLQCYFSGLRTCGGALDKGAHTSPGHHLHLMGPPWWTSSERARGAGISPMPVARVEPIPPFPPPRGSAHQSLPSVRLPRAAQPCAQPTALCLRR